MSKASDLVASATTTIVLDHPFFATLLLQMPRIEDNSIPTACTNGVVIKYNPDFIESLTPSQVAGLLVHEVMHPALGHLHRLPKNKEGNIAGDYCINNFLDNYNKSAGARKLELPEGGLLDHKYDGMSAEQVLADLRKNQPPEPEPEPQSGPDKGEGGKSKQRTKDEGGWGEFEEPAASPDGETSAEDMQSEWERRLIQAATAAKMQGKLPGCVEALIDKLVNAEVPWQQILERFVDQTSANDYSWAKPDRRFLPHDIIIPDLHDETLGEIVVAVDTSGSIYGCPDTLASFEAEINSLVQRCQPSKLTVLYCDAAIAGTEEYGPSDTIKLTPKGGGGTDFRPVGDWIRQHNITPRVLIYLTDLYGTFPPHEWPFPTIWCAYNNPTGVAPFGDTVNIK
jgi:predicted metal-dependent peptidase